MKQASVNAHKQRWFADGLVRSDGKTGASEWLVVSGAALLAMLPEATAHGTSWEALLEGRDLEGVRRGADSGPSPRGGGTP